MLTCLSQQKKTPAVFSILRALRIRQLTEKLAGGRLELIAPPDEGLPQFVIRHRPVRLIDAIWQRFAEEIAGLMTAVRCPAPKCGRWFPRNGGRSDRQFCSHACQMKAWRTSPTPRRPKITSLASLRLAMTADM